METTLWRNGIERVAQNPTGLNTQMLLVNLLIID